LKRLILITAALVVVALAAGALVARQLHAFLNAPANIPVEGVAFEIASGASLHSVSEELAQRHIIDRPAFFRLYARWRGQSGSIKAGDYLLESGATPADLLDQFTAGEVRLYSFTIIEGWNQWELLSALHAHEYLESSLTEEDWAALLEGLGAPTSYPEGLFLPETYRFPRGTTDRALLKQAYELMQATLAEEWASRSADLPISTPYEALILASIVEKETARADERARIAGVFVRRLQKRMRLQTDPTVIYGIGKGFNGNLTRRDLQTDTPYNTYTRSGLPPTPIALPGRAAIHAALHPAEGEELYFVATGLGDGSHSFSATKEEHDQAVADYLRRLRGGNR